MDKTKYSIYPEIIGDFSLVHTRRIKEYSDISIVECIKLGLSLFLDNNFNLENLDEETYYLVNYMRQKLSLIFGNDIEKLNISTQKAIKGILKYLITSKDLGNYILYQKMKIFQLQNRVVKLNNVVIIDPLTGLLNRLGLKKEFKKIIEINNKFPNNTSILFIDIDDYKRINDIYGHDIGDIVLVEIGKIFKEKIRVNDVAGRFGGEEFIIIMYRTDIITAYNKAQEIRVFIEMNLVQRIDKIGKINEGRGDNEEKVSKITVSIGIAKIHQGEESCSEALKRADGYLYYIKKHGKNQVKCEL